MPHLYNAYNCMRCVEDAKMNACNELCNVNVLTCDETIRELCDILLNEQRVIKSNSAAYLSKLYIFLRMTLQFVL